MGRTITHDEMEAITVETYVPGLRGRVARRRARAALVVLLYVVLAGAELLAFVRQAASERPCDSCESTKGR